MPQFDDILQLIEKSINRFNRRIPATQKDMLAGIEEDLRGLDVQNGNIKASVKNLSIIAKIKNRMTKILLTDDYKQDVKEFAGSFNEVTALQNQYWRQVETEYKPAPILKEIKNITIEDTVNRLMDSGLNANIVDPVSDILRTNITTGGSYRDLTDQLKQSLTDTNTPGLLSKYAKTLTTDSLNTYNGQYTQTVSSDLGFEWYKYDNTDIETTRPFCDAMTDIKYFHVSEIPAILRAEGLTYVNKKGERVPVPIYSKTGLPHGMKAGTNEANFLVNRGGWNCGHQCRPVSGSLVPDDVKSRVMATPAYIRWAALQRKKGEIEIILEPPQAQPVPLSTTPSSQAERKPTLPVDNTLLKKDEELRELIKQAKSKDEEWTKAYPQLKTEEAALLKYYTQTFFRVINTFLRTGSHTDYYTDEFLENAANGLDNALNRLLPSQKFVGEVHRWMTVKDSSLLDRYRKFATTGEEFTEPAFISTSQTAATHAFYGNAKFIINVKTGVKIEKISDYEIKEREVLLNRNTKFKMLRHERVGDVDYFYMEEI